MFDLGEIVISKEAQQKYKLSFILERLEEFKQDARHYFESNTDMTDIPHMPNYKRYEKSIHQNGEFILYIKSHIGGATTVLEASEYLGLELNIFTYNFKVEDMEFLRGVLERDKPKDVRGEHRYYRRCLAEFENLEKLKQQLGR